jgi:nucleoside-diphosphate-sugar epimerase
MRVCVTGASGKAGQAVVRDLLAHGHEVAAVDVVPGPPDLGTRVRLADVTDYGQAVEALAGCEGVVHLANIPSGDISTPAHTFTVNTAMNSNVFLAARLLGLRRVVWASSETTLGLPFDEPPRYVPIDEGHYPYPTSTYALSKVVGETMAEQVSAWSGIPFVGLRFSNIFRPDEYPSLRSAWGDPRARRWNLWSYIDARDVALSCRLGLEADVTGAHAVVIAAADTVMTTPTADLLREVFPDVPVHGEVTGYQSLFSTEGARQLLGFEPQHSWRDELEEGRQG